MKLSKKECSHCQRSVGVRKDSSLVRHKTRKGSKDQARCERGRS